MDTTITVQCPSCDTAFPVDPQKVPEGGARTQCTVCGSMFRVDAPEAEAWAAPDPLAPEESAEGPAVPFEAEPQVEEVEVELETPGLTGEAELDTAEPETEFGSGSAMDAVEPPEVSLEEIPDAADATEPLEAMEAGDVDIPAGGEAWSDDLGGDWVFETEDSGGFGEVEVERLDTVEEQMRSAQEEEVPAEEGIEQGMVPEAGSFSDFMTADEVMLSEDDLDTPVGESEAAQALEEAAEEASADAGGLEAPPLDTEQELEIETAFEPTPEPEAPASEVVGEATPAPEPPPQPAGGFQFGKRDPHEKARRLARVLVSDMITYNPERHSRALESGTLKDDFEEEIEKSWAEYVEQVGQELADSTPYWNEALNEILAKGEPLF